METKTLRTLRIIFLFCLFLLQLTGCTKKEVIAPAPPSDQTEPDFKIVGYLPEYRISSIPESVGDWVTDLIFFSVEPTPTGALDTDRFTSEVQAKLKRIRDHASCRVHIAVGGWGRSSGFASMAKNETLRQAFIDQLLRLCLDNQLSGADYDWEFPQNQAEETAYSHLIRDTQTAFQDHGLSVSVAVNPNQTLDSLAYAALDRIHIMSYDHGGRHSTLDQAQADTRIFLGQDIPSDKLYLGLPFYGRSLLDRSLTKTYADIIREYNPGPELDEWMGYYFNGIQTIQAKTTYAMEQNLGGVMIWEVGQDSYDDRALLKAINDTIGQK